MFKWIKRKLLKGLFKVEVIKVKKPTEDEILIFKFGENVPQERIANFSELINEEIESDSSYLLLNGDIDLIFTKKEKINWRERINARE